jgi:hypothetical protein
MWYSAPVGGFELLTGYQFFVYLPLINEETRCLRVISATDARRPEKVIISAVIKHVAAFTRSSACGVIFDIVGGIGTMVLWR